MQIEGGEARLHFEHVGSGLETRGDTELHGFAVAGADHKFHWADGHITGNTVIVSSRDVPQPVAVRYAWGDSLTLPNRRLARHH
jgi:sialate O-acetylesterase